MCDLVRLVMSDETGSGSQRTMELTRQEFNKNAYALLNAIRAIQGYNDNHSYLLSNWQLERKDEDPLCLYLSHPSVITYECDSDSCHEEQDFSLEDNSIPMDPQQYTESLQDSSFSSNDIRSAKKPIQWTFSMVYSETYRVPVLYFHVQEMNGAPYTRQKVLKWLYPNAHGVKDTWEFVSQEEHSFTGLPSFFLHPCQTSQRLRLVNKMGDKSILWTWMSMILPVVNHAIPPSYFLRIQMQIQEQNKNEGRSG
jgi:hypothetical protein